MEEVIKCLGFYSTIAKNSKTKKIQISFPFNWIPSDVRVAFTNQQRTTLQPTSSQVANHLKAKLDEQDTKCEKEEKCKFKGSLLIHCQDMVSSISYSWQNCIMLCINLKSTLFLSSHFQSFLTLAMNCMTYLSQFHPLSL